MRSRPRQRVVKPRALPCRTRGFSSALPLGKNGCKGKAARPHAHVYERLHAVVARDAEGVGHGGGQRAGDRREHLARLGHTATVRPIISPASIGSGMPAVTSTRPPTSAHTTPRSALADTAERGFMGQTQLAVSAETSCFGVGDDMPWTALSLRQHDSQPSGSLRERVVRACPVLDAI